MIPVMLAAPDLEVEPMLVRAAQGVGLRIVRRCVDAAELLAATRADASAQVVLSAGLPRLTVGLVDDLRVGRAVVGLAAGDEQRRLLSALGVDVVVSADGDAQHVMTAVGRRLRDSWTAPPTGLGAETDAVSTPVQQGRLVAVWGPQGAPGRTTVAIGVAGAIAQRGLRVCLVDADTYAPSVALSLGIVADVSGLVAACQRADLGDTSPESIGSLPVPAGDRLAVLTGLAEPTQWSDLRGGACSAVWSHLRASFDVCVVDVGFCLDQPEEGQWSRPRNAAGRSAVESADSLVAVGDRSAMGVARLLRAFPQAHDLSLGSVEIVRNRVVRRGRHPSSSAWRHAIRAGGVEAEVREVPDDPKAVRRAWDQARTVSEAAPRSRLSHALDDLARSVLRQPLAAPTLRLANT